MFPLNLNSIRLAWWNVNLSSVASNAKYVSTESDYDVVLKGILFFFNIQQCKLVVLCEVSEQDITVLRESISSSYLSIIEGIDSVGKTRFDTVLIYDHRFIYIEHDTNITKRSSTSFVKAGQVYDLYSIHDNAHFKLILCHWPSRATAESNIRRNKSATLLASTIQSDYLEEYDVIIMGDFNDNPFDKSIYESLQATRCHEMAIKHPDEWLYNPFWRESVSTTYHGSEHHESKRNSYPSGTYRHKAGEGAFWHTLDQILISGSLISTSNWQLNEKETKVISEKYFTEIFSNKSRIDHLPVVCELEYRG